MCGEQEPANVAEALAMLDRALGALAAADAGSMPAAVQADCLRRLAQAESSIRRRMPECWLRSLPGGVMRMTGRSRADVAEVADPGHHRRGGWGDGLDAAAGGPPGGAAALAAGELSPSWARPSAPGPALPAGAATTPTRPRWGGGGRRGPAGPGAAGGGDARRALAGAADARDDGFDRPAGVAGADVRRPGTPEGDLTPACTAALSAVLEALGKRAGRRTLRAVGQRRHDALEEACRRLLAAGLLPGRAGQPAQIQLHLTLDQLRGLPGAAAPRPPRGRRGGGGRGGGGAGCPAGRPGSACDAPVVPVVTGRVDQAALAALTAALRAAATTAPARARPRRGRRCREGAGAGRRPHLPAEAAGPGCARAAARPCWRVAAAILSGPGGLARFLR